MHDVIIIGAGPAGMFAADELSHSNLKVLVIDRENNAGGAGTRTDGKLNLSYEIGMDIKELGISARDAKKLIRRIKETYIGYGAKPILSGTDLRGLNKLSERVRRIRKRYSDGSYDIRFIDAKQLHMGSDNTKRIVDNFKRELISKGVDFMLNTGAESIVRGKGCFTVKSKKSLMRAKYLIVAPGRKGSYWFREKAKRMGVKNLFGTIDIGVRIEFSSEVYRKITDIQYDPKFKFITPTYRDPVRTFCTNPGGWVTSEASNIAGKEVILVNGYARKDIKTKNTNLALIYTVKLTHPQVDSTGYGFKVADFVNFISGHKPLIQRLGDLKKGGRSYRQDIDKNPVKPTFKNCNPGDIGMALTYRALINILEGVHLLDKIAPGVADDSTLLYSPEIKFYDTVYPTSRLMETNIKNLFVAGDGTGKSRGIVGAAVSGILAARGIIKKEMR